MKKVSSIIFRIGIAVVLLVFLFRKTNFKALFEIISHCDLRLMGVALLIFLFLNVLGLWRWYVLLKGHGTHVHFGRLCLSFLASQFFNLVLPSTVGGDTLRTLDIASHTGKHSSGILATVILDRLGGFFGMLTVLVVALVFGFHVSRDTSIIWATLILFALLAFLTGIMFSGIFFRAVTRHLPFKRIKEYLHQLHAATASYKKRYDLLLQVWFISCIIQAGLAIVYYFIALSIGLQLHLIYFWIFVPVITTFAVIPISIGGLGIRDAACVTVFAKIGVAAEKALALSLTNFGFMIILGLAGGASYVFALHRRRV